MVIVFFTFKEKLNVVSQNFLKVEYLKEFGQMIAENTSKS